MSAMFFSPQDNARGGIDGPRPNGFGPRRSTPPCAQGTGFYTGSATPRFNHQELAFIQSLADPGHGWKCGQTATQSPVSKRTNSTTHWGRARRRPPRGSAYILDIFNLTSCGNPPSRIHFSTKFAITLLPCIPLLKRRSPRGYQRSDRLSIMQPDATSRTVFSVATACSAN